MEAGQRREALFRDHRSHRVTKREGEVASSPLTYQHKLSMVVGAEVLALVARDHVHVAQCAVVDRRVTSQSSDLNSILET